MKTPMRISLPTRSVTKSIALTFVALSALALSNARHLRASHAPVAVRSAHSDTTKKSDGTEDWSLIFPRPAVGKYEDFAFPDTLNGWLISAVGVILHTADGGLSWTEQAKGYPRIRSIDFIDAKRGFAGTLMGKLLATTDGGVTWNDIAPTLPHSAKGFCGMTHVGEQMHIVGAYTGVVTDYFFSPDAGKTWRHTDLSEFAQGLVDVAFVNKKVGFIGGMGHSTAREQGPALILKTTDGGKKWKRVFQHVGGRGFVWKIFPINSKLIYAGMQSQDGIYRVAKSTDGGDHWDTLTVATGRPLGSGEQGIGFIDANTGWIGGFFPGMYATSDGGRTWREVPLKDGPFNRFEKVGNSLITAGSRGVLRYRPPDVKKTQ